MTPRDNRNAVQPADSSLLLGGDVTAEGEPGRETWVDYAIRDLESEKLVARYVGPAEWMAFNESVLRESVGSLQGRRFTAAQLAPETLSWSVPSVANVESNVPMPTGWIVAPGALSACAGLPEPAVAVAAAPPQDLTIMLRAAVWPNGEAAPATAASACSSRRGVLGEASYAQSTTWLGVPYVMEGVFARVGSRLVRLEILAIDQRADIARTLLAVWLKKIAE